MFGNISHAVELKYLGTYLHMRDTTTWVKKARFEVLVVNIIEVLENPGTLVPVSTFEIK